MLESTRVVDTVVLDKTGTVTSGRMAVVAVVPGPGVEGDEVVRRAGAAESGSSHPVARAVTAYAVGAGPLPAVTGLREPPGLGVVAEVAGLGGVVVGRPELLAAEGLAADPELTRAYAAEQARGQTVVLAGWAGRVRGLVAVADTVKPTSPAAVRLLRGLGLRPVLLTGDTAATAAAVAAEVGIADVWPTSGRPTRSRRS